MFIDAGLLISGSTYSNEELAYMLVSSAEIYNGTSGPPQQFLRFREASQMIEDFVFKVDMFQNIAEDKDMDTAYNLWNTIQNEMFDFINKIASLTKQVDDKLIELGIQEKDLSDVDLSAMKELYLDIFDETVNAVSFSTATYTSVFTFFEKYSLGFQNKNEQVSVIHRFKVSGLTLFYRPINQHLKQQ